MWNIKQKSYNKQNKNKLINNEQNGSYQRGRETRREKRVKGVKYIVIGRNKTLAGKHTIEYKDTTMYMLLTNTTSI